MNMELNNQKVIRISKKKFGIGIVVGLAIIVLLIAAVLNSLGTARNKAFVSEDMRAPMETSLYPDYYRGDQGDITDTREFLKTSYSGEVRTRRVPEVAETVKSAVLAASGRIDNYSISTKYASLLFVVPKSEFEAFRAKMADLTWPRLYVETVSAQNLLDQKQSIENRTEDSDARLAELKRERADLDSAHQSRLATLNGLLSSYQSELGEIRRSMQLTDDANVYALLQNQEASMLRNIESARQQISAENQTYSSQSSQITARINQVEQALADLTDEDIAFGNNIETVNGSMNIRWISVWEVIKIYSPIHPLLLIVLIIIIGRIILVRTGYLARIELV